MAYKQNSNGDKLTLTLDKENVKNGKAALKYAYSVADGGPGYCGATKNLGSADWTGFDGIRFWILSDGSNRETTFQFVDGAGAYWESIQKVTANEGWTEVKIPFSDFHVQQWGTAAETPTLSGVKEFSLYTGQNGNPGTGVWYFDDIGLYSDKTPVVTTETTVTTSETTETTTTSASETSESSAESTDTTASETSSETTVTTASETTASATETVSSAETSSETTSVTASETTTSSEEAGAVLYGDVNLDGKVDIVDAVLLNKAAAGVVELNATAKMNADCDADGTMSSNDALALLRFLVHIINSLPEKV